MARVSTPLGSHGVLRTTSVDEAQASVGASLAPHELTPLRQHETFRALHNAVGLERLSFHYIDYGSEAEVSTERLDFYLIQMPLAGLTHIRLGTSAFTATARTAAITAPGERAHMRYSAGNPRLMVQIAPDLLRERMAVAAAGGLAVPRWSGASFDISSGAGRSWRSLVDLLMNDLERGHGLANSALSVDTLCLALVDGLFVALSPPADEALAERSTAPRVVKRAVRLIEDHCAEPLGTPDIAEALGVSVRALQTGFKAHLDTSPMAYVRLVRLQRVREALTEGTARSVTDAAAAWGVTHLGRLSGDYRAAFGETPSETLRRAR